MAKSYELTKGARDFAQFLADNGLSDGAAAKLLAVTDVTVYHWRIGAKVPKDLGRRKIEVFTSIVDTAGKLVTAGIAPMSWDDGSEAKALAQVRPLRVVPGRGQKRKAA
jgi:hypothetical protein